jgi:hypothetical protein
MSEFPGGQDIARTPYRVFAGQIDHNRRVWCHFDPLWVDNRAKPEHTVDGGEVPPGSGLPSAISAAMVALPGSSSRLREPDRAEKGRARPRSQPQLRAEKLRRELESIFGRG